MNASESQRLRLVSYPLVNNASSFTWALRPSWDLTAAATSKSSTLHVKTHVQHVSWASWASVYIMQMVKGADELRSLQARVQFDGADGWYGCLAAATEPAFGLSCFKNADSLRSISKAGRQERVCNSHELQATPPTLP